MSRCSARHPSEAAQLHVEQERPWSRGADSLVAALSKAGRCESVVGSAGEVLAQVATGFKRGGKEARRGGKVRSCKRCWRCELARIIDARDVRDPRDKGLGTHTSGHQLAALARLHLASRFRLEVKWHVASNPPAQRLQISGQPRDVLCLLLFWSCWYQDGRLPRQVIQCRDLCMHMCPSALVVL